MVQQHGKTYYFYEKLAGFYSILINKIRTKLQEIYFYVVYPVALLNTQFFLWPENKYGVFSTV
jgi:hypothetical protein